MGERGTKVSKPRKIRKGCRDIKGGGAGLSEVRRILRRGMGEGRLINEVSRLEYDSAHKYPHFRKRPRTFNFQTEFSPVGMGCAKGEGARHLGLHGLKSVECY